MYVGLQSIDVQERKFGGFCAKDCYNTHRAPVELSGGWRHHSVRWEELQQQTPAGKIAFDSKRVRHLELYFLADDTPFEIWLDDIEFIPR
jgi:hypothetical protein